MSNFIDWLIALIVGLFSSSKTKVVRQLPEYLWFLTEHEGKLYSGAYHAGNVANKVYREDGKEYHIANNDESTRVYSLNGHIYMTSEGGVVVRDGKQIADLGSHYLLGAWVQDGKVYFAHAKDGGKTVVYKDAGSGLEKVHVRHGIFAFHGLEYDGKEILIGANPRGYRNKGSVVTRDGAKIIDAGGTAVRGTVEDGQLMVGFSYPARVASWKASRGIKWEMELKGYQHFGSFAHHGGKLYCIAVQEGGRAVLMVRDGGKWKKDKTLPAEYGVKGDLVNAAGFLESYGGHLYCCINSPSAYRSGPGYILRLK